MAYWQPYKLGVWLAEYLKPRCQLCQTRPSAPLLRQHHELALHNTRVNHFYSGILCQECHQSIPWLPKPKNIELELSYQPRQSINIQPATYYQYPINQVIRRFKYSEEMRMLPILVHIIRQIPRPVGCNMTNSVITPVPTTTNRLIKRGFNPLSILTPYLAAHWDIPIWNGVKRIDNTVSQRQLSRIERRENIKGAFELIDDIPVNKVLIFDDVATTGSTVKELATVLYLKSQSIKIQAYCVAHGNSIFQ